MKRQTPQNGDTRIKLKFIWKKTLFNKTTKMLQDSFLCFERVEQRYEQRCHCLWYGWTDIFYA